ncbi:hypothetical protein LA080_006049 [Diaporthe eres]|nr:hypothetical protein LA080_006049 [Diaporthe eres]
MFNSNNAGTPVTGAGPATLQYFPHFAPRSAANQPWAWAWNRSAAHMRIAKFQGPPLSSTPQGCARMPYLISRDADQTDDERRCMIIRRDRNPPFLLCGGETAPDARVWRRNWQPGFTGTLPARAKPGRA